VVSFRGLYPTDVQGATGGGAGDSRTIEWSARAAYNTDSSDRSVHSIAHLRTRYIGIVTLYTMVRMKDTVCCHNLLYTTDMSVFFTSACRHSVHKCLNNTVLLNMPDILSATTMGAGTWGAGWATAHPGKNQGGPCSPWTY